MEQRPWAVLRIAAPQVFRAPFLVGELPGPARVPMGRHHMLARLVHQDL